MITKGTYDQMPKPPTGYGDRLTTYRPYKQRVPKRTPPNIGGQKDNSTCLKIRHQKATDPSTFTTGNRFFAVKTVDEDFVDCFTLRQSAKVVSKDEVGKEDLCRLSYRQQSAKSLPTARHGVGKGSSPVMFGVFFADCRQGSRQRFF